MCRGNTDSNRIVTCNLVIGQQIQTITTTKITNIFVVFHMLFSSESQPYKVCGRNPVLAMVNSKSGDNQVCLPALCYCNTV